MRTTLHLAAVLAIATTVSHAQVTNPDTLIGKPPAPPTHQHLTPNADDLQWLWQYTRPTPEGNKSALLADNRFAALLKDQLKAPQAFWGVGVPLSEAAATFLAGPGTIASADNRHVTITGCVVDHCPQRGLLWLDLGRTSPLLVFAALRWNEQGHAAEDKDATFTLYLFPNHELDPQALPDTLKHSLSDWAGHGDCMNPQAVVAVLVEPDGIPHVMGAIQAGLQNSMCTSVSGTKP
jgi:hypothetical protein